MNGALVFPIAIPLVTAVLSMAAAYRPRVQLAIALLGAGGLLAAGVWLLVEVGRRGTLATQIGSWPAPFGISFVGDTFAVIMVLLTGIIGLSIVIYSMVTIGSRHQAWGYYPMVHVLLAGVCGAFLTGDIFNLFVWFEVMLIASFVLLALGGERPQLEGAIKYVALNLLSSALFLAAVGILYGMTGSLNLADLSVRLASVSNPGLVTATALLFLVAFGIKAAVFPLFFWLPASYHTPPAAVSALFAGLLTKVGVYALIRVFTLLFTHDTAYTHTIILWISGLTMLTGVLGAVAQTEFRRILSFHIISQIGYMTMGLALLTPLALAGSIFYIAHHILVKTNLFLVSGVVYGVAGSYDLARLGGLYRARPWLSIAFLVPALSLAGIPPLSGFLAKLTLAQAGLESRQYGIVAVALVVGLLTLFSMTKIWNEAFWKPYRDHPEPPPRIGLARWPLLAPIGGLGALTVLIGFYPDPLLSLALRAAESLLDTSDYIGAVLESRP